MIQKFYFGNPVDTGAVVKNVDVTKGELSFGKVINEWPFEWNYELSKDDVVYGLGESRRGQNKRGHKYVSWCSDTPNQEETTNSLYGAHNFIVISGIYFSNFLIFIKHRINNRVRYFNNITNFG